jgi:GDPmannose 4,6-dehydratase
VRPRLLLHHGDLSVGLGPANLIRSVVPDELYHLGAQSHVKVSFEMPEYTGDVTGLGTLRLLEAIRATGVETRFYQASSSELYGSTPPRQSETTPFHPRSPYAVAKLYGYWATVNYREAYGLFACNGMFNHESPRRGESFVTRKITRAVDRIAARLLWLGNLDAVRDWATPPSMSRACGGCCSPTPPADYILATGHRMTVREFCQAAFARVDLDWQEYVAFDPRYARPSEVDALIGDATKAEEHLGWSATTFGTALVDAMVVADIDLVADARAGPSVR